MTGIYKKVLCLSILCSLVQQSWTQNFFIEFKHTVGNEKVHLDTVTYKNKLYQPYTITKFKYYISNIVLTNINGARVVANAYFLIDESDDLSKQIILPNIPKDEYTNLEFTIGVDSIHNCSGVQTGALDPMNGMFWTWNTGYIFLKMEGKSPLSQLPTNLIEYHIGGYKQPTNCIRKISMPLNRKGNQVKINVDVAVLLNSITTIDFTKIPSVTDAKNATILADNYAKMFTLLNE